MYPEFRRDDIDLNQLVDTLGLFELIDDEGNSLGIHRAYRRNGQLHVVPAKPEPEGRTLEEIMETLAKLG